MVSPRRPTSCGQIGMWLAERATDRLDLATRWAQSHVANCPRCRRQILGNSRLRLALLLIKTQPHRPDLLMQANRRAINILKRSLRETPTAERLRHMTPSPAFLQRLTKYTQPLTHAAACLAILLLLRTGIFSSMKRFHDQGAQAVKQYYTRHLDQDTLDELF